MRRSLLPAVGLLAVVSASACLAEGGSSSGDPARRFRDPVVGWSVAVPKGWRVDGRVVSTAFAEAARCRSVLAVDGGAGEGVGPGPGASRSLVQVCARALGDGHTLARYLAKTYGDSFASHFEAVRVGGRPAYRSRGSSPRLVWLQTGHHRIQLAAAVTADPAHRRVRGAEVDRILRSFRVTAAG